MAQPSGGKLSSESAAPRVDRCAERVMVMGKTASQSVIVRASMKALEYREEAWRAHDREAGPPDPGSLPDPALLAIMRYPAEDLPPEARRAVRSERRRRVRPHGAADAILGLAVLALLGLSGIVIGWFLLVP